MKQGAASVALQFKIYSSVRNDATRMFLLFYPVGNSQLITQVSGRWILGELELLSAPSRCEICMQ